MVDVTALHFDGLGRSWGPLPVGNPPRVLSGGPPPKDPRDGRRWFVTGLVVVLLASLLAVAPAALRALPPNSGDDGPPAEQGVSAALEATPLSFVENRGQVDGPVSYYLQGSDTSLYFTPDGVTFALSDDASSGAKPSEPGAVSERWAVKLDFVGANSVAPTGIDRAEATVSYLGTEAGASQVAIPTYNSLVYEDLWPGIDMIYEGTGSQLKYSFVVHPGADPSQIRLAYRGASGVTLNDAGQIAVTTPAGGFADDKPYTYQDIDGQRATVPSAYALDPGGEPGSATFGIPVGAYDTTKELVIDPTVVLYAGFLGGSWGDQAEDVAVDDEGSAYVTGFTGSPDFPATVGAYDGVGGDPFVAKVNAAGTGFVYVSFLGAGGLGVAVDDGGYAYVAGGGSASGKTVPADSPLTFNGGGSDAYVSKINPTGTALVYAAHVGGAGFDSANAIALDGAGNAYITGITQSGENTFAVTVGPDLSHGGPSRDGIFATDGFVAKLDPSGTNVVYAGYIGGAGRLDQPNDIAVDDAGAAYVTGTTDSTEATFPVTVGPDLTFAGVDPPTRAETDAFVVKVHPSGANFVYAGYIGGSDGDALAVRTNTHGKDDGNAIAVDSAGHAYVTGETMSTEATFPATEGGVDSTHNGFGDVFVAKVAPSGAGFAYAGYIGGGNADIGYGIAVDDADNVYVTGRTNSVKEFPLLDGPSLQFGQGGGGRGEKAFLYDAFVTKLTPSGGLVYSGFFGGAGDDWGKAIAVDHRGNAYIAGHTSSQHLVEGEIRGLDNTYNGGSLDAFVAKIGQSTRR